MPSDHSAFSLRLDICRGCSHFVHALEHGACDLIRDPSERVCRARFTQALWTGVCPIGNFEEVNRSVRTK